MRTTLTEAPTGEDTASARRVARLFEQTSTVLSAAEVVLTVKDLHVPLSGMMVSVILAAARLVAEGHPIDVVAADGEVSAQEAADFLKVSRPYLINMLNKGVLPYRMVGTHHRIPMSALVAYQREQGPRRRAALEELSAETQELNRYDAEAEFVQASSSGQEDEHA